MYFRQENNTDLRSVISKYYSPMSVSKYIDVGISELRPTSDRNDHSLSGIYGYEEFPLHTDYAQNLMPPKFIILYSETIGAYTYVNETIKLLKENKLYKKACTAKVIINTGNKFRICEIIKNGVLRFNPSIMKPLDNCSKAIFNEINEFISSKLIKHDYSQYNTLIINNWSCTHARPSITNNNRKLYRVIGGNHVEL